MVRSVTVTIAGKRYSLRSDVDDRTIRELAAAVDARVKEIQRTTKTADTQSLMALAALQFAEEVHVARRRETDLRRKVRERSTAIIEYLEREARV